MTYKRGDIYLVDWSPGRGSEQAGVRPALIIQNEIGNRFSPTVVVAAISTKSQKAYPFHVLVSPEESGLPEESIVKLEQIMTIDKERLIRKVGSLSDKKMEEIEIAINRSLGLKS